MNTHNDWKGLLEQANEDIKNTGKTIRVQDAGDGYYFCEILKDGVSIEVYAENFYEWELSDLVTEVWHYVKSK